MTFRLTLAAWVMLMIGALAPLLILVQDRTLKLATEEAATSTMDGVSARTITLLREQVATRARDTHAVDKPIADRTLRTRRRQPGGPPCQGRLDPVARA